MKEHRIGDPLDLHKVFRVYRSHDGFGWLFRGQADAEWRLVPKAGRDEFNNGRDLGRFNAWRELAVAYTSLPDDDWECLAVAQHHGLVTRLLDWSLNPLVATFFAVAERNEADGAVYCYSPDLFIDRKMLPLDKLDRVACFLPRAINERMNRQAGVFTAHPDPATPLAEAELAPPLSGPNLVRVVIPSRLKLEVREILADYGVHLNGVFPDLDGLSRHVNWQTANSLARKRDRAAAAADRRGDGSRGAR
jgi:hypothetical protein